jgi:hypothetical protein
MRISHYAHTTLALCVLYLDLWTILNKQPLLRINKPSLLRISHRLTNLDNPEIRCSASHLSR